MKSLSFFLRYCCKDIPGNKLYFLLLLVTLKNSGVGSFDYVSQNYVVLTQTPNSKNIFPSLKEAIFIPREWILEYLLRNLPYGLGQKWQNILSFPGVIDSFCYSFKIFILFQTINEVVSIYGSYATSFLWFFRNSHRPILYVAFPSRRMQLK